MEKVHTLSLVKKILEGPLILIHDTLIVTASVKKVIKCNVDYVHVHGHTHTHTNIHFYCSFFVYVYRLDSHILLKHHFSINLKD